MTGETDPTPDVHRALADERRRRIVEELRGEPSGLGVAALAQRLGLHPNTVRFHLGVLADAGLVGSHAALRTTPGRPRILYTLEAGGRAEGRDDYRLLATVLAGAVASETDASERCESTGREWGRYLVRRPPSRKAPTEEEAMGEVVDLLDAEGFAPEARGNEILLRRCPFHDLAEEHPEITCSVHRGLVDGALQELGSELEVGDLDVFVEPDLCIARLRRRAAS
jgi:predicted ArsR family transcriptional regulator